MSSTRFIQLDLVKAPAAAAVESQFGDGVALRQESKLTVMRPGMNHSSVCALRSLCSAAAVVCVDVVCLSKYEVRSGS